MDPTKASRGAHDASALQQSCAEAAASGHPELEVPPIVAILGPTAVGKSALALDLAARFDGEIISADSRQIYRHLNIGTAKPSEDEQNLVRHHLIDIVDPDETYSVARFVDDAKAALSDLAARNRTALLVGGTGYYARALLEGQILPRAAVSVEARASIASLIEHEGIATAIERIRALDPSTAARLDPSNPRRVTRALELIEAIGGPIPLPVTNPLPAVVIGLSLERSSLYTQADARVDHQMSAGLVEETRHVLSLGFSADLPVLRGLAYGQAMTVIQGSRSPAEAAHDYKLATHRLIRRQLTWFRSEPRLQWVDSASTTLVDDVERIIRRDLRPERET